jgi:hypothetical protein
MPECKHLHIAGRKKSENVLAGGSEPAPPKGEREKGGWRWWSGNGACGREKGEDGEGEWGAGRRVEWESEGEGEGMGLQPSNM